MATAFTYQGRLTSGGNTVDGLFDLKFSLYDLASGGNQIGSAITNQNAAVSNGLFAVQMDFGASAFDGGTRWLEIGVRTGTNGFAELRPRQQMTPAPMAVTAGSLAGVLPENQLPVSVPRLSTNQTYAGANTFLGVTIASNPANSFAGNFSGVFSGNGAGLTNLDAAAILAPANTSWIATTNWVNAQGYQSTNGPTRKQLLSPVALSGTNYVLDFAAEAVEIQATNNVFFLQSTNRTSPGWYGESVWFVQGGVTNRTLRFNSNWAGVGTLATNPPVLILSNKLTIVAFSVRGASETNVTYAIVRQE
jgi:hypothetical protein